MASSNAYAKFLKTIHRCERMVGEYEALHQLAIALNARGDGFLTPSKDIVRGAVVLGVAALDAYVTDVFTEKLVKYLKRYTPSDSLVQLLNEAGLDTRMTLKLITMDRPYRGVRTLIDRYLKDTLLKNFGKLTDCSEIMA